MFNLKNKVAIVTGASGGLGEAMALALAEQGAKVAILDLKNGTRVAKKIKTKSKYYKLDVTNEEEVKQVVNQVKKEFGSIDILINNAGIYFLTPVLSTKAEDWDKMLAVNLKGYFLMSKYCVPHMKKGGRIINVSSIAGHHAFPGSSAYNSSKGAVIQLTKTMAVEFADKINVNAICPGVFVTPMTKDLLESMQPIIKNSVPLKRAGQAKEIGGLAVYLASDEASYMTGSIITIDGGWVCHS